jgi:serine phosphatase RsbU (regulator of sigma subunit)
MSLQLNAGDKFYIYSNDILEIQNAHGKKYGRERLLDVISSSKNDGGEVVRSIRQNVSEFSGSPSPLKADIAIAVMEYTPTADGE